MITVEIKVNGNMVGHIYGQNLGRAYGEGKRVHDYRYEYYNLALGKIISGSVLHSGKLNIEKLINEILSDIEKKGGCNEKGND